MPLKIGKLVLPNNLIAAPMAGFTDTAWRILARSLGAGAVFSEMVSVEGVKRRQHKSISYMANDDRARPFGIQIFGAEPKPFEDAFDVIRDYQFDLIDINMGCPVKKVVKKGAGAALMRNPILAASIIKSVRKKYSGPLTVKIRSGWDEKNINAAEFAQIAEDSGADAIIIHPRTKSQGFKGISDWRVIREVKESVKIPVIGNGDVVDAETIRRMFDETGCDGIMIGRAALGEPWIFGTSGERPDMAQVILRHLTLLLETGDGRHAIIMMRKFMPKYLKGVPNGRRIVQNINNVKNAEDLALQVSELSLK